MFTEFEKMFDMNNEKIQELLSSGKLKQKFGNYEDTLSDNWIEDIQNQLKQFNKLELYQWLTISSLHPSNNIFVTRYELLIYTLLNIPEKDFLNKKFNRNKFEFVIKWFENKFASRFIVMEDWEPFSQMKLIPLFFEKNKYYFFYGASERPYEFLKHYQDILFTKDINNLKELKNEYLISLDFQTKILKSFSSDKEAKQEFTSMYVPSIKFFKKYSKFIELKSVNNNFLHNRESDFELGINNFNGLYTEIDNKYFFILPQCHIEIFYQISNKFLSIECDENCFEKLTITFQNRMKRMVAQFFDIRNIIEQLPEPILNKNTAEFFDTIVRVDANKIILFKFLSHSDEDLLHEINTAAKQTILEIQKVKNNPYIGLKYLNEPIEKCNIVPPEVLEFKVIILFEELTLNYMLPFEESWIEKDIHIFNTIDIKPIFELLKEKNNDTFISFLQYLEAEKKQSTQSKNSFMKADTLDSFAYYYNNSESFFVSGSEPDMMMYAPHEWSSFYNKYLFEKYQDNIYELIEAQYPNQFNIVQHMLGETYSVMDSMFIHGGRCIKYKNELIWVMYPPAIHCDDVEVKSFDFLGQFISFYVDNYKVNLFKLFSKYGFNINEKKFTIGLYPHTMILRNEELKHLKPYIENISDDKILFLTKKAMHFNNINTFIIYDSNMESLVELFKMEKDNDTEKNIFKEFISSVLKFYKVSNYEEVSTLFIEKNWHLDNRAFTFNTKHVDNPRLELYREPKEIQDSFTYNVNKEIVVYLKSLAIEPKKYWNDDAKHLNNLIFEFLQNRLEEEISKFNSSILFYNYTQIEYIEGAREQNDYQAGLDSINHTEFDVQEKYSEQRIKISQLAISIKHILHTILKVNPNGHKALVDSDWYYLIALSNIINDTIQRSDQLHYKIAETGIEITNSYEMIDIDKSSTIDFNAYHQHVTTSKIIENKNSVKKEKEPKENKNSKKTPIFDVKLNESWNKDNGFYLDDMVVIVSSLGRYDFERDHNFPLNLITFDEINKFVQDYIAEPPPKEEIERMLDFLSLDFSIFNEFKYIDYSIDRLMQKKHRINLSPFIKIENKYLFGNQLLLQSSRAWFYPLIEGDAPFTVAEDSYVKTELKRIHRELDLDLEDKSYNIAKEFLGEKYSIQTLSNFKRISKSFEKLPPCGEIDLLLANPSTKTIFVLDAKNVNKKLFTSAIKRELREFFHGRSKKKSYLEKLNLKVDFITSNLDKVLEYFKLENDGNWNIKKGFVVNTLYFSAFYEEKVDFILLDDLEEYLKN
ncbi:hypothetical protein ACOJTA_12535 [Malaciobacter sp. WC5094]